MMKSKNLKFLTRAINDAVSAKSDLDGRFEAKIKSKKLGLQDIQDRLTLYRVVRNFKGTGNKRFAPIKLYLNQHGYKKEANICAVEEVNNFIKFLISHYNIVPTSAATKLLWPYYKKKVVIYDRLAVKSLLSMGAVGIINNYEFYYEFWMKAFNEFDSQIMTLCKKMKIMDYNKIEFRMRVFDKYLWILGDSLS